jgi:hypothetical protein
VPHKPELRAPGSAYPSLTPVGIDTFLNNTTTIIAPKDRAWRFIVAIYTESNLRWFAIMFILIVRSWGTSKWMKYH